MNCSKCQELLVAHVEGILSRQEERDVVLHLHDCRVCRVQAEALAGLRDRLVRDGRAFAGKSLDVRVMDRIFQEREVRQRRITMLRRYKGRLSLAAAAAAMIIVGVLAVTLLYRSVPTAYALEQTIEANRMVRTIHLKAEPAGQGISDAWAQFDDDGNLLLLRMDFPQTIDGPKVVIWQKDKAEVWFKAKKLAAVFAAPDILAKLPEAFFDPWLTMERLDRAAAEAKAQIEIVEPSAEGERVRVIATYLDPSGVRKIYLVHPETKLLEQVDMYKLEGGEYEFVGRVMFLEYNEPIDPAIFALDLPADITRIDQTTQQVGLLKGDLSDEEIAVEVVRQFFEALIAEDYGKAGRLVEGIPAAKMREVYGKINFVRIVSLGTPTPHPNPKTRFLCVPCEVEIEVDGVKIVKKFVPNVRSVYNQPDRWGIGGGI